MQALGDMSKIEFPGYFSERMASGNLRHRVRVEGHKRVKITLPFGPDDPRFQSAYIAARAGLKTDSTELKIIPNAGTVGWLVTAYLAHLRSQVQNGQASALTLKQRKPMGDKLIDHTSTSGTSTGRIYRDLPLMIPPHELIAYRDSLMATPGAAHNTFKFIKAMYAWAVERGHCPLNPAAGIKVAYKNQGGAIPWTIADLEAFKERHPFGTTAHLFLTLFMFTACRISDGIILGRENEKTINGTPWLSWQPDKAGSKIVEIPVLPPLQRALAARKVIGTTFILTDQGKPYTTDQGMGRKLKQWCSEAGIEGKTSHGIRKAAGHLLALHGATQYEIMAVHGHANASTSQVYTKDVERLALAEKAVARLSGMKW